MLLLNTADLGCSFSQITCEFIDVIKDLFNSKNFCVYHKPKNIEKDREVIPDLNDEKYSSLTSYLVTSEPTVYLNNHKFLRVALRLDLQ